MEASVDRMDRRRQRIVELLRETGSCNVGELASALKVSTVTLRSDLNFLEQNGCIARSFGKAVLNQKFVFELDFQKKEQVRGDIKQAIGRVAARLVGANDTLLIDSGSTAGLVPRHIDSSKRCTIMTNGLNLAGELIGNTQFTLMMTGGTLQADSRSLCGPIAEQAVRQHHFDTLFLGADGIDFKAGITTTDTKAAQLNRAMIDAANRVVLLSDSSKFDRRGFCVICPLTRVDTVVTDKGIPEAYRQALAEAGVRLILADEEDLLS